MKKTLIFILVFLFWNIFTENIFANDFEKNFDGYKKTVTNDWNTTKIKYEGEHSTINLTRTTDCPTCNKSWASSQNASKEAPTPWEWLNSSSYMFSTKDFVPGWTYSSWWKTEKKFSNWLITIIRKLVIPFWVLAVFVMTIWAWYMILSNWNDEMLNKWKKIFKMWIFSTVIVLSSYIIVELVKNLLYAS